MSHLLALQSDVVNAFLESAEAREPWRRLFVQAAIDDAGTMRATAGASGTGFIEVK